jgi:hypothetical protein
MGHVKEPNGVDFIIQSEPLTEIERVTISEFIRSYKAEQGAKQASRKRITQVKSRRKASNIHPDQK